MENEKSLSSSEKRIKYFKEHLDVLILIPTLLGGLWQLIELIRIDLSYLRFFSITQVISDGLLVLMYIIILYLMPTHFFSKKELKDDVYKEGISIKKKIIYITLLILLILGVAFAIWEIYNTPSKKGLSIFSFLAIYYCATIILQFLYRILVRLIKFDRYDFLLFVGIISFFLVIYNIKTIFNVFHNLYYMPNSSKFKNIEYLECYLGKKRNEFNYLYSNDKFIFIEDKETKYIEIVDFEELLNKDNCK